MISGVSSVQFSCFKVRFCSAELCHSLISCAGKTCCLERLFILLINLLPSLWLLSEGKLSAMPCCYISKHAYVLNVLYVIVADVFFEAVSYASVVGW